MDKPPPYADPEDEGNSAKYHTGKECISCTQPAGTWWSHLWCFDCNVKRMVEVDRSRGKMTGGKRNMENKKNKEVYYTCGSPDCATPKKMFPADVLFCAYVEKGESWSLVCDICLHKSVCSKLRGGTFGAFIVRSLFDALCKECFYLSIDFYNVPEMESAVAELALLGYNSEMTRGDGYTGHRVICQINVPTDEFDIKEKTYECIFPKEESI